MKEMKQYTIAEICSRLSSGKGIPASKVTPTGPYPVIGGNGVRGYTDSFNFDGECAIIGRQGANCGNVRYFQGKAYMTEHAIVAIGNENANTKYLACLFSLMHLGNLSAQSAQPGLSVQTLSKQIIYLPEISTQNQIADIIKSLDTKIELNNRINHNLEQQAQALYKSWFVDFEPFRGEKFVDSELGLIPEGWRVGQLSEICEIVGGGTPSKVKTEYYTNNGIHWLTPKDLSISCKKFTSRGLDDITELGYKSSSAKLMPKGAVLFSSRAPIGYLTIAKNTICTNQGFKSAVPGIAGTAFLYYYLKFNTEYIKTLASGSTFKEASGSLMKSLAVVIPPKMVFDKFEDVMARYFDSQENIELENSHHVEVRDSLLPRLMSGKLKINDLTC